MKRRILAIDDEVHMLKLLERLISEKTTHSIKVTNNALEAVDILEEEQFDLVITDLKMPAMDGMQLIRLMREKNRTEEIIMITAFACDDSESEAKDLGVSEYIEKPFKKERLIEAIDRAMGKRAV